MYPDYCRDTFTRWVTVPRDAGLHPRRRSRRWRRSATCSPRSCVRDLAEQPDRHGACRSETVELRCCAAAPGLVVVDEAYAEFRRPGTASALALLADHPRLVVTRTMSKAFA